MSTRKGVSVMAYLPSATVARMDEARAKLQVPVTRPETRKSDAPTRKLFLAAAIEALAGRVLDGEDVSGIPGFREAKVRQRSPAERLNAIAADAYGRLGEDCLSRIMS